MNQHSERLLSTKGANSLSPLSQRALKLYQDTLKDKLEPAEEGKGIAIHPDSCDYVIAQNPTYASRAMRLRHPAGSFITMRIGPSPDYGMAARLSY